MQKILLTAILAGGLAGLVSFGLQQVKLTPLIAQAEIYEHAASAEAQHDMAEHEHAGMAAEEHHHDAEAWTPAEGFQRNVLQGLADIGVGIGYALLLVGAFSLRGRDMSLKTGLLWGAAGFAAFALAPALGLPPELPGSLAADLTHRQLWWLATAACTAGGLALLIFHPALWARGVGVAALIAPHVIGAPEPHHLGGTAPVEMGAQFAVASLAVSLAFWLVLGGAAGGLYKRLGRAG